MEVFLATDKWNTQICDLFRSLSMPGDIEISYRREPDFFQGIKIQGKELQVVVVCESGKVISTATRSIRPLYINGELTNFGLLNNVRVAKEFQGSYALARGYKFISRLHQDGKVRGYLASFVEENKNAIDVFTKRRIHLPYYFYLGKIFTYAVPLKKKEPGKFKPQSTCRIIRGSQENLADVISFLNSEGPSQQFFPHYVKSDFKSDYLKDFHIEDFYIALQDNKIAGVIGKWDQEAFKQNVIINYHGIMRLVKPLLNSCLDLTGYQKLPQPCEKLSCYYATFICIANNNTAIFSDLLHTITADNFNKGYHYCLVCLHENNKLQTALKSFLKIKYTSLLYYISWYKDLDYFHSLDSSLVPYIDPAGL